MSITVATERLKGNDFIGLNRLPKFRAEEHDKLLDDSLILEEEREGYGVQTGDRFLPYLMQDQYSRERKNIEVKTIILENEYLKATFYPDYGMRLSSLYDKIEKKELLFKNPVLQFANLAIRRAWFSGGIEWNLGHLGHAFTTCEPLFAVKMEDSGEEFIRCFEFERCKGLYWYLDFHLKPGSRFLAVYAHFVNVKEESVPFYWWTNIAVKEKKGMRIFSGSPEIIYIKPSSMKDTKAARSMGHGTLPFLPDVKEGADFTYPESFTDYSNEYFFQNEPNLDQTWEAASYADGSVFFDRASENLRFHKMFCWGELPGGHNWRDYLSAKDEGNYVELQAGFAPTQMHGIEIPAGTTWDFVQVFGHFSSNTTYNGEWIKEKDTIYTRINEIISAETMQTLLEEYRKEVKLKPETFLSYGKGYGALEELKQKGITPKGFFFPPDSIKEEEQLWKKLLETKELKPSEEIPTSFMSDNSWKPLLESADKNAGGYNLLGILYLENGEKDKAESSFKASLALKENAFALRNLACILKEEAEELLERAIELSPIREYYEELFEVLIKQNKIEKAWTIYETLPDEIKANEAICFLLLPSALTKRNRDFLASFYEREVTTIREGARVYTETYLAYKAMEEALAEGCECTDEYIRSYCATHKPPQKMDFLMG